MSTNNAFVNQSELGLTPTPSGHLNKSSPVSHAHVITNHLPRYFALISRVKMEVKIVEGQGGVVSSKVVPLVQAVLSSGSVNEPSFFGLQVMMIMTIFMVFYKIF